MTAIDGLLAELKTIPHLKLDLKIDVSAITAELAEADYFVPFIVKGDPASPVIRNFRENMELRGLLDFTADSDLGGINFPLVGEDILAKIKDSRTDMTVTDLGQRMPKAVAAIRSILGQPARC